MRTPQENPSVGPPQGRILTTTDFPDTPYVGDIDLTSKEGNAIFNEETSYLPPREKRQNEGPFQ